MRLFLLPLIAVLMLSVSACTGKNGTLDLRKPASLDLTPPPGPPEYQQGWTDGCESGMHVYSGNFYKAIRVFNFKQDANLRNNKMYYQVWKDAYLYCVIYWDVVNNLKI